MFRKPYEGGDAEAVVAVSSGERMVVRRRISKCVEYVWNEVTQTITDLTLRRNYGF
jgi:predicted RNA-binding protein associated with RNAse of E/G family